MQSAGFRGPSAPLDREELADPKTRQRLPSRNSQKEKANWIKTVPGHGWFPIFRFYGPEEAYFDKSWKLPDIEKANSHSPA
jgi:hypothetical protein